MKSYAGIDQVRDTPTRAALRYLWDAIHELDNREAEVAALDLAELSLIRAALQRGGSTELNVSGLGGLLLQRQLGYPSYYAVYTQTADQAGTGYYYWDSELYNSAPHIYARHGANNTKIIVKQGGSYLVLAMLGAGSNASGRIRIYIYKNTENICYVDKVIGATETSQTAHGRVVEMASGDFIRVELTAGATRKGDANGRSLLTILRVK